MELIEHKRYYSIGLLPTIFRNCSNTYSPKHLQDYISRIQYYYQRPQQKLSGIKGKEDSQRKSWLSFTWLLVSQCQFFRSLSLWTSIQKSFLLEINFGIIPFILLERGVYLCILSPLKGRLYVTKFRNLQSWQPYSPDLILFFFPMEFIKTS